MSNLSLLDVGDLQLCAYSAIAFAMGLPMKDDADPEPIEAAGRRILAVTGMEGDDDG